MNIAKVIKSLSKSWREEADAMKEEELRNVIVESTNNLRTVEKEMAENEALQDLKARVKDASAGYSDAKKAQNAKIAYALHLLEQKGKI